MESIVAPRMGRFSARRQVLPGAALGPVVSVWFSTRISSSKRCAWQRDAPPERARDGCLPKTLPAPARHESRCCPSGRASCRSRRAGRCRCGRGGYGEWLAHSQTPKLFINAEPARYSRAVHASSSRLPNQREVTVKGIHYVREDSPDEIGLALRAFVESLVMP